MLSTAETTYERPCRAKDRSACPFHSQVDKFKQQMEAHLAIQDFEGYYQTRRQHDFFVGRSLVEEGNITEYEKMFPQEWDEERRRRKAIAAQLARMNRTEDYSSMSWELFAKLSVNYLTPQSYGIMLQNRWMREQNFEKVNASDERGDFYLKSGHNKKFVEFKVTAADGDKRKKVNFVQIRPHHNLHRYHMVIVDKETGVSQLFVLSKAQMQQELEATNSALAHGTRAGVSRKNDEYVIRFEAKAGNPVYERWMRRYAKPFPIS